MKSLRSLALLSAVVALMAASTLTGQERAGGAPAAAPQGGGRGNQAPAPPPAKQPGHGNGKLVVFADVAVFSRPGDPANCFQMNRFRRGQRIGWRIQVRDGGTGEIENTAMVVGHITVGGKTMDINGRWRGTPFQPPTPAPTPRGYLSPPVDLWNVIWTVPEDAPTGMVRYSITATDAFGRTAEWAPFSNENSQITIVQ